MQVRVWRLLPFAAKGCSVGKQSKWLWSKTIHRQYLASSIRFPERGFRGIGLVRVVRQLGKMLGWFKSSINPSLLTLSSVPYKLYNCLLLVHIWSIKGQFREYAKRLKQLTFRRRQASQARVVCLLRIAFLECSPVSLPSSPALSSIDPEGELVMCRVVPIKKGSGQVCGEDVIVLWRMEIHKNWRISGCRYN
jgi:hypothetical protein